MNALALQWALDQRQGSASERFVLAIIASRADRAGTCWPGVHFLAEATGLSPRTVRRAVQALEVLGLLVVEARQTGNGRSTSNRYRLSWAVSGTPETVDKSVDNLCTDFQEWTQCQGHPVTVTPSEGVMVSPLEDHTTKDPVDDEEDYSTAPAVDKACPAQLRGDTDSSSAPSGAPAESARECPGSDPSLDARRRFDLVDAAFRERFGHLWRRRSQGPRRTVWLEQLAGFSDDQVRTAIARALKPTNSAPPSAYAFSVLALPGTVTRPAAPGKSSDPEAARRARAHLERLQGRAP